MLRSRAAFAANVTKCMNKLNEDIESNKAAQIIEEDIERLQENATKVSEASIPILNIYEERGELNDAESLLAAEKYINDLLEKVAKSTELAGIYITKLKRSRDDDQLSHVSKSSAASVVSMRVAAANVKAEKAAVASQAEYKKKQLALEEQMAKLKIEQSRLQIESENIGFEIKERVLRDSLKEEESRLKLELGLKEESKEICAKSSAPPENAFNQMTTHYNTVGKAQASAPITSPDMQKFIVALLMPDVKIKEFDGSPLEYWTFIRFSYKSVGKTSVDTRKKLTRLISSCVGKAANAITHCNIMEAEEGYKEARRILKARFGNDLLIREAWLNKITGGKIVEEKDEDALQTLNDEVRNCTYTLKAMGQDMSNMYEKVILVVARLPQYLRNRW